MKKYDCIVIGAGHAGIEAAFVASRMHCKTLMLSLKKDSAGVMSCNPAIGGVGKGQLVREVDALGGQMARAADRCAIQFRMLNASKGPAVQSLRAQIDKYLYNQYMLDIIAKEKLLEFKEEEADKLIIEGNTVKGIITKAGEEILSSCVIIAGGTFLSGLIHVGLKHFEGGRINEIASLGLSKSLKEAGLKILRFKTGTCPRLDKNSINYSKLIKQCGDERQEFFSYATKDISNQQVCCHITYTNNKTHEIIKSNLDKSPLYSGIIKATGVRYCPSIEDKVVKFTEKIRHQIFLEPEGLNTDEIYPNGLSTSLPEEVQLEMIHSVEGLEEAKVINFGYGIEHDVVEPTQLYPTLETKLIKNLFLAGQINGTTGYEEAAAQGIIAGINAALRVKNKEPFILDRSTSYIGVLIDDLTSKGTTEPYRMFTSRVEYRLLIRQDNADLRLKPCAFELGLVNKHEYEETKEKEKAIKEGIDFLKSSRVSPTEDVNNKLEEFGASTIKKSYLLEDLLKRPQLNLKQVLQLTKTKLELPESALHEVEIEVKYSGFIQREISEVRRFKDLEKIKIPENIDYAFIQGLSKEIKEKLKHFKPINLGQASRISGITPASISLLMVYLRKLKTQK